MLKAWEDRRLQVQGELQKEALGLTVTAETVKESLKQGHPLLRSRLAPYTP